MSTPGPWELHQESGGFNSCRVCVPDLTIASGCRAVAEAEILGMPRAEAEANARLIAAAPQLYEALQAFYTLSVVSSQSDIVNAKRLAEAALAKAGWPQVPTP